MASLPASLSSVPSRYRAWRAKLPRWADRLFGLAAWGLLSLGLLSLIASLLVTRGLPGTQALVNYQPPLPTNVRAIDGTPMHSYARERRVFLPINETPKLVVNAFLAAEDKTFYQHGGLDYAGIAQAALTNLEALGTDKRPVGASTITQQVAKNLLLTNEVSVARKLREAVLARRIERELTKDQILELYLNEIFLGRNAYGIEAASQAYFGKQTKDLTLPEAAYLAILPKAPSTYNPDRNYARALARRDYVLRQMQESGWITAAQRDAALATPIRLAPVTTVRTDRTGDYFLEELRRQLIARFGETAETGPNSVYAGGLWVRATIDPKIQAAAERSLRDGLMRYERGRGWRGAPARIEPGDGWRARLAALPLGTGYPEWRKATVLGREAGAVRLGFADGSTGRMPNGNATMPLRGVGTPAYATLKPGDVIAVAPSGSQWALRQIPSVQGAMVVQEVHSGRVLAMVGGFDLRQSSFNRATQALRQPGSSFKPFVYAAGLDAGMTPASLVLDAPYCVYQSRTLGTKCFRNFSGGYAGSQTMRWGLEQSRNLMTVRIAYNGGMDRLTKLSRDLGIGDYPQVLAISLGAGETTPMRLVNAYATMINGGRAVSPVLYDLVQGRDGRAVFRADARPCEACLAPAWNGQPMPRPADVRRQVMDARTAYQVVHMMEGVVQRGTATVLRDLPYPVAGKTGTTTGPTDVWFVGGTPDIVAGLYIGHDRPRPLGGLQGGTFAAPIWKQWAKEALTDQPNEPFLAPAGVRMVRIDRRTGRRVFGVWPTDDPKAAVIWEAFKPEAEPRRLARANQSLGVGGGGGRVARSDSDFLNQEGGIY